MLVPDYFRDRFAFDGLGIGFEDGRTQALPLFRTLALRLHGGVELLVGDGIHRVQAFEGVFAIEQRAGIKRSQVIFSVIAGDGSVAEEDGDFVALRRSSLRDFLS